MHFSHRCYKLTLHGHPNTRNEEFCFLSGAISVRACSYRSPAETTTRLQPSPTSFDRRPRQPPIAGFNHHQPASIRPSRERNEREAQPCTRERLSLARELTLMLMLCHWILVGLPRMIHLYGNSNSRQSHLPWMPRYP